MSENVTEGGVAIEFPRTTARVWTLENGLEVIVKEDHSAPVVSLQAWVRTGSIHEDHWLGAGMSHFLEHMLFKGTSTRDASEVAQQVQAAGGYINAYTSFDRTVYWIDAPADGFETCLDVLCDVVGDAQLPKEEFDREQDVIRREFAMGDDNP
ncbi:MAG: insulinase family protein, partial [Verrucomicrobiales bacterium]|nr:insulinase family protein [Verrucomicrobiales bacterium]